jgi:hypothetical protein
MANKLPNRDLVHVRWSSRGVLQQVVTVSSSAAVTDICARMSAASQTDWIIDVFTMQDLLRSGNVDQGGIGIRRLQELSQVT